MKKNIRTSIICTIALFFLYSDPIQLQAQKQSAAQPLNDVDQWYTLGRKYFSQQTDSAIYFFRQAMPVFDRQEIWEKGLICRIYLGRCFKKLENPDSVSFYYQAANVYAKKYLGVKHNMYALTLANLGSDYSYRGDYDAQIRVLQESISIVNENPGSNEELLDKYYYSLAAAYRNRGDYDEAIRYYEEIIARLKDRKVYPHPEAGKTFNSWAKALELKLDHINALQLRKQALLMYQDAPAEYANARIVLHHDLAWNYLNLNDLDSSLYHLEVSDRLRAKANRYREEVGQYIYAEYYLKKGDYPQAELTAQKSLQGFIRSFSEQESHPTVGQCYDQLGRIKQAMGDYEEGMQYCLHAVRALSSLPKSQDFTRIPSLDQIKVSALSMEFLQNYGRIAKEKWRHTHDEKWLRLAYQSYQRGGELIPQIRQGLYAEGSRIFFNEKQIPFVEEAMQIGMQLQQLTSHTDYTLACFRFMELSNLSVLYENLNHSRARLHAGISLSMLEEERALKKEMNFFRQQLREKSAANSDQEIIDRLQQKVFGLKQEEKALEQTLEQNYPAYYHLKYAFRLADVHSIQSKLDDSGTLFLQYFWGKDSLYLCAIGPQVFSLHKLGAVTDILPKVLGLKKLLEVRDQLAVLTHTQDSTTSFHKLAIDLFGQLLGPIQTELREVDKLIFAADGPLGYIPMEILVYPDSQLSQQAPSQALPYLIKTHSVRYVYSGSIWLQEYDNRNLADKPFLGVGPAYGEEEIYASEIKANVRSDFTPLAYNQEEVQELTELMKGRHITGYEAREERVKLLAPQYRILHFAMHAFTDDVDPLYSGLVFAGREYAAGQGAGPNSRSAEAEAEKYSRPGMQDSIISSVDDGILYAYEIYNMSLGAELAVLSACHTGAGQLQRGEGVMSLARAFSNAGCGSVVMSLWEADGAASKQLMVNFYRHLDAGLAREDALRQAKLDYLASANPSMVAPYFWGNFVLIGKGGALEEQSWSWWVWLVVALVGSALLAFAARRTPHQL